MESKLTIVLTLKDRSLFTKRWMSYMNDMRCPHKILIADGGKDPDIEESLRDHRNYENLNYEYIRYPYDSYLEDYYKKLDNVISQVKTPYILLADNDDFYVLDRVSEILDVLDNDEGIIGARGRHVNFTVYDVNRSENNNPNGTHYIAITNDVPSIDANTSIERIEGFFKNMPRYDYYMNWYSIFRTSVIKNAWKTILGMRIKEVFLIEIILGMFLMEKGKVIVLPFTFYLRQSGTSQVGDTLVHGNDFLERCILANAFSDFNAAVEEHLVSFDAEQKGRVLKALAGWLELFIVNLYIGNMRIYRLKTVNRFLRYIKSLPRIGCVATHLYWCFFNFLSQSRKRKVIRVKQIEKYILK